MMRRVIFTAALVFAACTISHGQEERIRISKDIELIRITDHAYVHVSYGEIPSFGRVGSNGVVFINDAKALLFDTPINDSLTRMLVSWIQDTMGIKVIGFVPNHWHSDCMGGLAYLQSVGIESYANQKTIEIARSKGLPVATHAFKDSLVLWLGDKEVVCSFPGAAHTMDNIVVWIPSERILFAGCMVKEMNSKSLGNTSDGDLTEYPKTIKRVMDRYGDARFVIPGHGRFGGVDLLEHTLELASHP